MSLLPDIPQPPVSTHHIDPADILLNVFPNYYLVLYEKSETERRSLYIEGYRDHLNGKVLFVMPGSVKAERVEWLALHLNEVNITDEKVRVILDTLEGLGVHAHVAKHPECGCQLFVLLEEPCLEEEVVALARHLKIFVGSLSVGTVTPFPNNDKVYIPLPYRGAGLHSESRESLLRYPSLDPISLPELATYIKKTQANNLHHLADLVQAEPEEQDTPS